MLRITASALATALLVAALAACGSAAAPTQPAGPAAPAATGTAPPVQGTAVPRASPAKDDGY